MPPSKKTKTTGALAPPSKKAKTAGELAVPLPSPSTSPDQSPVPSLHEPVPTTYQDTLGSLLDKVSGPGSTLGESPILRASILCGAACTILQHWLDNDPAQESIDQVLETTSRATSRAFNLVGSQSAELKEFEAGGSQMFGWVQDHAPGAARKWQAGAYPPERKWLLKAAEQLNTVLNPPGRIDEDLLPFFYALGETDGRIESVCTMHATWMLALDAHSASAPRFGAVASHIHTWLRPLDQPDADEVEIQAVTGGTAWLPQPLFAEEDFEEGNSVYDSTNCNATCTYHYLRGYVNEYHDEDPEAAYLAALQACPRNPLARNSLEQINRWAERTIAKAPYGPDKPRPAGMSQEDFITFLIENAVKKMRERFRRRAERSHGKGVVAPYARSNAGAAQLNAIESWLKVLGERAGVM